MATTGGDLGTVNYSSHILVTKPSSLSRRRTCSVYREPFTFKGVKDMIWITEAQYFAVQGKTSRKEYISFQPVILSELAEIDEARRGILDKHCTIRHYADRNLLIVKLLPSEIHTVTRRHFFTIILRNCMAMGADDLILDNGARYTGADGTSQEADFALKPLFARRAPTAWPTLMVQAGWSESLDCLRIDARWWLEQSRGEVKIVIIISVFACRKKFHVEKWVLNRFRKARKLHEIEIDLDSREVNESPLILEFEKIFLRPRERRERDIVFAKQELLNWADHMRELSF